MCSPVRCQRIGEEGEIDHLYFGVLAITALFAVILVVCVTIKYRNDVTWSLIPFFIAIGIFVWASIAFFSMAQNNSPK